MTFRWKALTDIGADFFPPLFKSMLSPFSSPSRSVSQVSRSRSVNRANCRNRKCTRSIRVELFIFSTDVWFSECKYSSKWNSTELERNFVSQFSTISVILPTNQSPCIIDHPNSFTTSSNRLLNLFYTNNERICSSRFAEMCFNHPSSSSSYLIFKN